MDTKTAVKTLNNLRAEIDALLEAIPDRLDGLDGLKMKLGRCTFTADGSFSFKLEGALPGGKSRDEQDYETLRQIEGMNTHNWIVGEDGKSKPVVTPGIKLPPIGTVINIKGQRAVIVGARLRAKYNVTVAYEGTDKRMCYRAADIARMWAAQSAKETVNG